MKLPTLRTEFYGGDSFHHEAKQLQLPGDRINHPGQVGKDLGGIVIKSHVCMWLDCLNDERGGSLLCECLG